MARMLTRTEPGRVEEIFSEHVALLAALRARKPKEAERRALAHVRNAHARLTKIVERMPIEEES